MKLNADWHKKHVMPKNATFEQRVKWHLAHQKHCACRPIPQNLAEEMKKKGLKSILKQQIMQELWKPLFLMLFQDLT